MIDMAKIQIKSERLTPFGDYFQSWSNLTPHIICKFSNERMCKRNKDVQGLSCGFEDELQAFFFCLYFLE